MLLESRSLRVTSKEQEGARDEHKQRQQDQEIRSHPHGGKTIRPRSEITASRYRVPVSKPVERDTFAGPSLQKSRRIAWCLVAPSQMIASCWGSTPPGSDDQSGRNRSRRWFRASCSMPYLERTKRGLYENRGPDPTFIPHNRNTLGNFTGSSNYSGPWGVFQNIPLLFYAPGHVWSQGSVQLDREVTLAAGGMPGHIWAAPGGTDLRRRFPLAGHVENNSMCAAPRDRSVMMGLAGGG